MHTAVDSTHLTYLYTTLTILELVFAPRLVSCARMMKPPLFQLNFPPSGNSLVSLEAINDRPSNSYKFGSMTQYVTLYNRCSRGYVQVNRNRIDAKPDVNRKRGILRLDTIAFDSYLRIYEPFSQTYICVDQKGKIISKHSGTGILCVFRELMSPDYFTELQSVANSSWFIGFRSNGSPINGPRRHLALKDGSRKSRKCDQFIKNKIEIGRTKRKQTPSSQQPRPKVNVRKWSKLSEPDSKAGPFASHDETLIRWLKSLSKRRRRF